MFDLAGIVIDVIQKDSYTMIANFKPYVLSLLYTLCMLDLILNVSFGLLDAKENPFVKLAFSVFKYAFIGYIVNNYKEVLTIVIGGGIQLGNIALGKGNETYFSTELFDFLYQYVSSVSQIFLFITVAAIPADFALVESLPMVAILLVASLLSFVFWTLISLVIQIGKVFLISAFAYPLIVFTVFSKTKDIGMKALSSLTSAGIYMFVLTTLLNVANHVWKRINEYYPPVENYTFTLESVSQFFTNLIGTALGSFVMFLLLKNADAIASMLSSGVMGALNEGGKGVMGFIQDSKSAATAGQGQNPFKRNPKKPSLGKK